MSSRDDTAARSLRCADVSIRFSGIHALKDVSLEFAAAEITAIIGPNGAGKSTLVNVLTGFALPDSGRWFAGSNEITGRSPRQIALAGVGRTFQNLRLVKRLSVLENVMLARPDQGGEKLWGALFRRNVHAQEHMNREAALAILHRVGLATVVDHAAGALSYGQQKLLSLACSLAMQARILLLDEPVAGVHPAIADELRRLLLELKDDGYVVVFIEHDLDVVQAIADRLIVMDRGQVMASGSPSEVLRRPEIIHAYVN